MDDHPYSLYHKSEKLTCSSHHSRSQLYLEPGPFCSTNVKEIEEIEDFLLTGKTVITLPSLAHRQES